MKKILLSFALAVGLLASASTAMAQTVNMSRYITLTVKSGEAIKIDFQAAAAATPVRIVSGSNTQNITVDTGWYDGNAPSNYTVTAGASTMTVYGDLTGFYCEGNDANLTALDPSHNTQLKELWCGFNQLTTLDVSKNTQLTALSCHTNQLTSLDVSKNTQLKWLKCHYNSLNSLDISKNTQLTKLYCSINHLISLDVSHNTQLTLLSCSYNGLSSLDVSNNTQLEALFCYGNNLSTQALDDIFCSLPDRRGKTNGWIQPVYSNSLSDNAIVLATNKANATAKNWKVQYRNNNADIPATTGTYVCGSSSQPNMDSYITLTVTDGAAIKLDFKAAAAGTPVRIVSGSNTQDITVGTGWYNNNIPSTYTVTAGASTMTVYGDIIGFDCSSNGANLTSLDPSHNTQLTVLYCHSNNFTTATLDDIYCALPDRTGNTNGKIQPIFNSSSPNHATVLATNKANATAKNWKVQYSDGNVNITTTGSYVCGSSSQPNMDSYITLTVANGQAIKLDFRAAAAGTPVRIVSGSNTQDITVGTGWYNNNIPSTYTVTAGASTMTVYGDIIGFDCSSNGANLTALDVSHNTQLTLLSCKNNNLTTLDVNGCTQLTRLNCRNNSLNSLDISQNTQLKWLYCSDNKFTTATLDDIYCALPDRTGKSYGWIQPVYNSSSSNHATVLATNAQNAITKNWKVQYYENDIDIPTTTGSYVCGTSHIEPNMNRYITLTVKDGEAIRLNFKAAADDTPVRIVSGSNKENITVGTNWIGIASYTAGSTTMTIYGDITRFNCSGNGANLTAIDLSHNMQLTYLDCSSNLLSSLDISKNTKLTTLYCHGNNLSTQALDDIFCALPDRTGKEYGVIQPVYSDTSSNHATVLATNKANAIAKNWKVQYYDDDTDIPTTTGSYVCPVKYDLSIAGVQVTSANCSDLSVIDGVSGTVKYDPTNEVLTLQNATIQKTDNTIAIKSSIDGLTIKVIGTNNLTGTMAFYNSATITGRGTLNVEIQNYPAIYAYETYLAIDGCTVNAKGRWGITGEEDSSGMLAIKNSTVTAEGTYGYGSIVDFASLTLDGCAITQPAGAAFDASLKAVALGGVVVKSKVVISKNSTDIAEAAAEQALTLYPNPVSDVLYLSATARTIRIYNIYGIEVAHATDTDRIDVANLPAGVYTVKADGTVAKMVKR